MRRELPLQPRGRLRVLHLTQGSPRQDCVGAAACDFQPPISSPQSLKPPACRPRISGSVPRVSVPKVVLDDAEVGTVVVQGEATRMAQHVRPDAP
jgi:hypothetical protein